jgi:hypothetical protein
MGYDQLIHLCRSDKESTFHLTSALVVVLTLFCCPHDYRCSFGNCFLESHLDEHLPFLLFLLKLSPFSYPNNHSHGRPGPCHWPYVLLICCQTQHATESDSSWETKEEITLSNCPPRKGRGSERKTWRGGNTLALAISTLEFSAGKLTG